MSTPMHEIPSHVLMPVDANGQGPAEGADMAGTACWCGCPNSFAKVEADD